MASETGALGAGTSSPEVRANKHPAVAIEGAKERSATVGQPLTVVTLVTDDGVPKRRGGFGGAGAAIGRGRGAAAGGASGATGSGAATPAPANPLLANPAFRPPSRVTVGKVVGLHLSWFIYRGAGKVAFDPPQVKPWEDTRAGANSPWAPLWQPPTLPADGKWEAKMTFDQPGTYVLRALADDGALLAWEDLTVIVTR